MWCRGRVEIEATRATALGRPPPNLIIFFSLSPSSVPSIHPSPQIASALKDISRIMRADGIQAQLWDAQVFTRPAARRVNEAKASAARAASRKFRWSMGWVARRRERGF